MRPLAFDKYEGLGNDFVVLEVPSEGAIDAASARRLCDRRFGVGADGVLLLLPSDRGDARMRVINADGSVPEMCGNGLRCLALHLARARALTHAELTIETDAGLLRCAVDRSLAVATMTVAMGEVRLLGDATLEVDGAPLTFALADVGNPHAVTFDLPASELSRVGPRVATHARFPKGTNVEIAALTDGVIHLQVWERGAGATLACGTGACATVAVACATGRAPWDEPIRVELPGGALQVSVARATRRATLRGPARHVFTGRLEAGI